MTIFCNRTGVKAYWTGLSLKSKVKFQGVVLIPLLALALLAGCEEDPSRIGGGILPGTDFTPLTAVDTFGILSYTNYLDTVRSKQPAYTYLGSYYNPYFGLTSAGFATQMWLYGAWPGRSVSWDSLILTIRVSEYFGESPDAQEVNIWEVDEFMHLDTIYYTNRTVPVKQLLGTFTLNGISNEDTTLTFHMPRSFIDELMRDTTMIYLAEDTIDFRNYFNGLYFEFPQTQNYHMARINLTGGTTNLTLHYTDTAGVKRSFIFLFNTKAAFYNTYQHDYDLAEPGKKIENINQQVSDTVSYIQGFNGVYTTISIPGLEELKSRMPLGINKARLYIPAFINDEEFTRESMPESVLARYVDADGQRMLLTDYQLSADYLDGKFYALDEYYILNITNFVQEYLEGEIPEPEFEILLSSFSTQSAILYSNSGARQPRLEVVYTGYRE